MAKVSNSVTFSKTTVGLIVGLLALLAVTVVYFGSAACVQSGSSFTCTQSVSVSGRSASSGERLSGYRVHTIGRYHFFFRSGR
jgi:hypothetical protein